jgi:hypothetical protein
VEKKRLQEEYGATINEVNQRISDKAKLQINLNETRDNVRDTNQHVSYNTEMNSLQRDKSVRTGSGKKTPENGREVEAVIG